MEKDKEKVDEEINENEESQNVADSKEDNVDEISLENNEENVDSEEEETANEE